MPDPNAHKDHNNPGLYDEAFREFVSDVQGGDHQNAMDPPFVKAMLGIVKDSKVGSIEPGLLEDLRGMCPDNMAPMDVMYAQSHIANIMCQHHTHRQLNMAAQLESSREKLSRLGVLMLKAKGANNRAINYLGLARDIIDGNN